MSSAPASTPAVWEDSFRRWGTQVTRLRQLLTVHRVVLAGAQLALAGAVLLLVTGGGWLGLLWAATGAAAAGLVLQRTLDVRIERLMSPAWRQVRVQAHAHALAVAGGPPPAGRSVEEHHARLLHRAEMTVAVRATLGAVPADR